METSTKQNRVAFAILQTAIILLGLTVYAAGVVLFILPLDMIAAGTTGLGLFAQHFFAIPLSGFCLEREEPSPAREGKTA